MLDGETLLFILKCVLPWKRKRTKLIWSIKKRFAMLLEAPRFLTMSVVPRKLSLWKLRSMLITCVSNGLKGLMSLNPLRLSLRKERKKQNPTSLSSNMAKNSQLGLYFILFLSRPRLVIPCLSATVSETGHWEWCCPPAADHLTKAGPLLLSFHHTCMTSMQSGPSMQPGPSMQVSGHTH